MNGKVKLQVTDFTLLPCLELLDKCVEWLHNQSCERSSLDPNFRPFYEEAIVDRPDGEAAYKLLLLHQDGGYFQKFTITKTLPGTAAINT